MRTISSSGSKDIEFGRWRCPFLSQSDMLRSPAPILIIFLRWILLDRTVLTRQRSFKSDHSSPEIGFANIPLLIPLYTRKSALYLSQFTIVSHRSALVSHLLFKLFQLMSSVFVCVVIFLLGVVVIVSIGPPASSKHISLNFFTFQRVFLGCFSSIYHIYHCQFTSFTMPCILVIVNPSSAIFSPSCHHHFYHFHSLRIRGMDLFRIVAISWRFSSVFHCFSRLPPSTLKCLEVLVWIGWWLRTVTIQSWDGMMSCASFCTRIARYCDCDM